VRERDVDERRRVRPVAADDPHPRLARVVVTDHLLAGHGLEQLADVAARRDQAEERQQLLVGAAARGRVGLVEVAQSVLARDLRGDDLRLDRRLEVDAADALDLALDPVDAGAAGQLRPGGLVTARRAVAEADAGREQRDRDDENDCLGGAPGDWPNATDRRYWCR
jgi:hypothetical protein